MATVELSDTVKTLLAEMPSVHLLPQTKLLVAQMTQLRKQATTPAEFVQLADRVARLVLADSLSFISYEALDVATPTGTDYSGLQPTKKLCGVSIVRAGESMEGPLREWYSATTIGKILIQRDEETALPHLFFDKLPADIAEREVILMDPMLATGGSAIKAIEVLQENGVKVEQIVFANIVSCPEGLRAITKRFPELRVVTGQIDSHLNERRYIIPGLGDYGDRYYNTVLP
eukprot:m.107735 g.107735  ORF g.107735 m.107735 type:complete len:231 (-) comp13332_c0_seq1:691-1383(-)